MKNKKKYHTVGTVPKIQSKIRRKRQIDTPETHEHDSSFSVLGSGTSVKKVAGLN